MTADVRTCSNLLGDTRYLPSILNFPSYLVFVKPFKGGIILAGTVPLHTPGYKRMRPRPRQRKPQL